MTEKKRTPDRPVPKRDEELEKHEPTHTVEPIPAPKFGSAGSGGAEFERLPEQHDDKP
ncbi:MAG: hypothetical protein ACT4O1_14940 [Gemmatimonadota bacterium]